MWPKFGNSSIAMGEVIITSILEGLHQKNHFFWGVIWFKFNNLVLALGMAIKFYTIVAKGLKLKSQKVFGADSYVCRRCRRKTGRGFFAFILNRVKACNSGSKRDSNAVVFLWILQNFYEDIFLQNASGGCFCLLVYLSKEIAGTKQALCFILQISKLQETRTTRKNKITNQRCIYNPAKLLWWGFFAKKVNLF